MKNERTHCSFVSHFYFHLKSHIWQSNPRIDRITHIFFTNKKNPMHVNNVRVCRCWKIFRRWSVSFVFFFFLYFFLYYAIRFGPFPPLCLSVRCIKYFCLVFFVCCSFWILWTFAAVEYSTPESRLAANETTAKSKTTVFDFHCVFNEETCAIYCDIHLSELYWTKRILSAHRCLRRFIDCVSWFACNNNMKKEEEKKNYSNKATTIKRKIYRSLRINQ